MQILFESLIDNSESLRININHSTSQIYKKFIKFPNRQKTKLALNSLTVCYHNLGHKNGVDWSKLILLPARNLRAI